MNDFYVSYQGQQALKGMTTTLVLGNAFDKEYWSPQGIPQDGRNGKNFRELSMNHLPRYFGAFIWKEERQ